MSSSANSKISPPPADPSSSPADPSSSPADRRAVLSWCLFDWANSPYPTVVVTFVIAAYFTTALSADPQTGTALWGAALSISGLAVALIAPVLGAVADQTGRRKPWIAGFAAITVVSAMGFWWVEPDPSYALLALVLVVLGNSAFELGQVFYNAMLPEISARERLGRISGWAWGLGYAGGLACLVLVLVLFVEEDGALIALDRDAAEHVRIAGPFVGLWFALFALPLFFYTPDAAHRGIVLGQALVAGLRSLWATLRALPKQQATIGRFLLARMLYTDGLNTLFAFGGVYAAGTFAMSFQDILQFGILLNVAAGLGAVAFSWVDDKIGAKRTIVISLLGLIGAGTAILLVDSQTAFTVLGCIIGVFIGPAQAASRSMMARLAPIESRAEIFGLYALSGKATAFAGPALVGAIALMADSQRVGMAVIPVFFVAGLILLLPLRAPAS